MTFLAHTNGKMISYVRLEPRRSDLQW